MNQGSSPLESNLAALNTRIAAAAGRVGRRPEAITLLPVSKYISDAQLQAALALGLRELAENRVQNLVARRAALGRDVRLHLIGPLQSNKLRKAVATADEFHALDRIELVAELAAAAGGHAQPFPLWIQVNVAQEPQKHGCSPDDAKGLIEAVLAHPTLALRGLMTMAPHASDPEEARPHFRALRQLSADLLRRGVLPLAASALSMGMSNDFEIAIEEGATLIRVGSALFGRDDA